MGEHVLISTACFITFNPGACRKKILALSVLLRRPAAMLERPALVANVHDPSWLPLPALLLALTFALVALVFPALPGTSLRSILLGFLEIRGIVSRGWWMVASNMASWLSHSCIWLVFCLLAAAHVRGRSFARGASE